MYDLLCSNVFQYFQFVISLLGRRSFSLPASLRAHTYNTDTNPLSIWIFFKTEDEKAAGSFPLTLLLPFLGFIFRYGHYYWVYFPLRSSLVGLFSVKVIISRFIFRYIDNWNFGEK